MGVNLLLRAGNEHYATLRAHVEQRGTARRDQLDFQIIRALHGNTETRSFAVSAASDSLRSPRLFDDPMFEIASDANIEATRDRLIEAAFSADRTIIGRTVDALRAVAKFDPNNALAAARAELMATSKTADEVCRAVVQMAAPQTAA